MFAVVSPISKRHSRLAWMSSLQSALTPFTAMALRNEKIHELDLFAIRETKSPDCCFYKVMKCRSLTEEGEE